jgi:Cu/Ag efflux protein CusF
VRRRALAVVLLALVACGRDVEYVGAGEVVSVDEPRLHVTIRHEDIPGLMGAMTMRFAVGSPDVLAGVEPGAHVRFRLRPAGGDYVVTRVEAR